MNFIHTSTLESIIVTDESEDTFNGIDFFNVCIYVCIAVGIKEQIHICISCFSGYYDKIPEK